MYKNWIRRYGEGRALCGPEIASIPKSKPQWLVPVKSGVSLDGPIAYGDIIYFCDNKYNITAVDKHCGKPIWKVKKPYEEVTAQSGMPFVDEQFVIFWPIVFNRFTGEIVQDLTKHKEFKRALRTTAALGKAGKYLYKQVDNEEYRHDYAVYNLESAECTFITVPYNVPFYWTNGDSAVVRQGKELISFEVLSQRENWRLEFPENIDGTHLPGTCEGAYYLPIDTRLYKIDLQSGQLLWTNEIADYDEELLVRNRIGGPAVCDDMCYVFGPGTRKVYALSSDNGELLWTSKTYPHMRMSCIAGDLLFVLLYQEYIALDRYTGEEVWRLDDRKYDSDPIAIEGQLLVQSFGSYDLISYAWDENNLYHSPAKPE